MIRTSNSTKRSNPERHVTIGYALSAAREDLKLSLTQAAQTTKIKPEQLAQFESGRFSVDNPYHRGLLESYARFLELDIVTLFSADEAKPRKARKRTSQKSVVRRRFNKKRAVVASTSAKTSLAIGFVVVAFGGVVLLVYIFFAAPKLVVEELADVTYTTDTSVVVRGSTSSGSDVFINSTPVLVGTEGDFEQQIFLRSGVNVIAVEAVNSLSSIARVEKIIIAEYESFD